jgi:putative restriction endonuclease
MESTTGRELWEEVSQRLRAKTAWEIGEAAMPEVDRPVYGELVLVRPRLGQGSFRMLTANNYERRCAVTGEKALPVLDAAHIQPVAEGGQHRLTNGLLLRTDVHRLFDAGYVTVTPDGRFQVSPRLKSDFDNGEPYMPHHGKKIWMPGDPAQQPDRRLLEWHADVVYLK